MSDVATRHFGTEEEGRTHEEAEEEEEAERDEAESNRTRATLMKLS